MRFILMEAAKMVTVAVAIALLFLLQTMAKKRLPSFIWQFAVGTCCIVVVFAAPSLLLFAASRQLLPPVITRYIALAEAIVMVCMVTGFLFQWRKMARRPPASVKGEPGVLEAISVWTPAPHKRHT